MAFSLTWDEANPVNGTTASNIDDEIRNTRIATGERLVGMFSDWRTAVDRVHARKIFVDAAGLEFRNDTDTTTLATLTNLGALSTLLPFMSGAFLSATTGPGGGGGNVAFPSEIIDTDTFHDNAVNNSRLTVPAGKAGTFFAFATAMLTVAGDNTGAGTGSLFKILKNGANPPGLNNNEAIKLFDSNPGPSLLSLYIPVVKMCLVTLNVADFLEVNVAYTGSFLGTYTNFNFGLIRLG